MNFVHAVLLMKLAKLIEFLRDRLKTVIWVCLRRAGAARRAGCHPGRGGQGARPHRGRSTALASGPCSASSAASLIILFSKWYGHLGIMTREDYYDE